MDIEESLAPESDKFLLEAKGLVAIASGIPTKDLYIVWFAKTLGNWKALVSTDVENGLYFEATHNGAKNETYIDSYRKYANICIPGEASSQEGQKISGELVFETAEDAKKVLIAMADELVKHSVCTMADLYDFVDLEVTRDDSRWGWRSLAEAKVIKIDAGYTLSLPNATLV